LSETSVRLTSSEIPEEFTLEQNYPNPFNPSTNIRFTIPASSAGRQGSRVVSLKVFDILAREVATLVNETLKPGSYTVEWNASGVPSGVYFYRMEAGAFTQARRLVVLK
jgi:hypothetical protein